MPLAVPNQYAKALLAVVSKPGSTLGAEQALEQLGTIEALIQECPELRVALLSPAISGAQKKAAIERLGGMAGLHALMQNFWNVIISHRRSGRPASIPEAVQAQTDEPPRTCAP